MLDISAVQAPLSGIGRYSCELAAHLPRVEGIDSVLFVRGTGVDAHFDPAQLPRQRRDGGLRRWLKRLPGLRRGLSTYRRLKAGRVAESLDRFADHVYLSPNFSIPRFKGRSVATIHDLSVFRYPEFHPRDRVEHLQAEIRYSLANANHLLTDSHSVRDELLARFHLEPGRVSVAPLGVDSAYRPRPAHELRAPLAAHGLQAGRYVLTVGTIEPRKNLDALLDAHARLDAGLRRQYPLVIVGAYGWSSRAVLDRIRAAPAGEVIYLDYVPESELPLIIGGAAMFCCASHYEGFGLPVLEAFSSGVPVVCADNSALSELAGGCALMWPGGDPESLAGLIARALEDGEWRERAVADGLARSGQYRWRNTAEAVAEALRGMVDR
nr:glycosyltransferase family 1 protein [Parahaliea mediterranea]